MLQAQEHCIDCGLKGTVALQAEQTVASLERAQIWRHSVCGHVLCYRTGLVMPRIGAMPKNGEELATALGHPDQRRK